MDDTESTCKVCSEKHEHNDRNHIYNYVDEVVDEYHCTICLHPIQQPMDTPCGHTFCTPCIEPCIQIKKLCPNCRKPLGFSDLRPSTFLVRNILDKLRVYCPLCKEILCRQQLEPHLTNKCSKVEQPCKYTANGCTVSLARTLINEHISSCEFKNRTVEVRKKEITHNEPVLVELVRRHGDRLGLTIYGGSDTNINKIVIQDVIKLSICERDGRLKLGDQLLEVNGASLRNVTHRQAFNLLNKATSPIKLLVLRPAASVPKHIIEELMIEPHIVELHKDQADELGIRIMSSPREPGVKVLNLIENSIAEQSNVIKQHDQILNVNGISLHNVSQQNAADIIKSQTGHIKFLIQRSLPPSECRKMLSDYLTSIISFKPNLIDLGSSSTYHIATLAISFDTTECDMLGFSVAGGMGSILGDIPVFVVFVNPRSPAHSADLRAGDQVTKINNTPLTDMAYNEVLTLLKNLNVDQLFLTIKRIELDNPRETHFSSDWPFCLPSKGSGKLTTVTITRSDSATSLGFRIVGGVGSHQGDLPVAIKSISRRSIASRSSLRPGDHVLGCNGVSLINATHESAAQIIKNARGDVKLTVLTWPHIDLRAPSATRITRHRSLDNLNPASNSESN